MSPLVNAWRSVRLYEPLVPPRETKRIAYDYALEGLRGLAAFWVGYSHVFGFQHLLDSTYHLPWAFLPKLQAAHGSVLVFFVLSGYVIGLTTKGPCTRQASLQYLLRRLIRLFPIYAITIGFTIFVSDNATGTHILGNLLFLQGITVPLLSGNVVLWTLNYEVVYYLVFLLIWRFQPRFTPLVLGLGTLGILGWFMPVIPQLIPAYTVGMIFWVTGLWLAWKQPKVELKTLSFPLFSYLFLLLATDNLSPGVVLLNGLGFSNPDALIINLSDLAFFPLCLLLMATLCQRSRAIYRPLLGLSLLMVFIPLVLIWSQGRLFENMNWIMASIFFGLSLLTMLIRVNAVLLVKLSSFGGLSYAFYLLHMPILLLVSQYYPFSGSIYAFFGRLILWFTLTVLISYVLEHLLQPQIKSWSKSYLFSRWAT